MTQTTYSSLISKFAIASKVRAFVGFCLLIDKGNAFQIFINLDLKFTTEFVFPMNVTSICLKEVFTTRCILSTAENKNEQRFFGTAMFYNEEIFNIDSEYRYIVRFDCINMSIGFFIHPRGIVSIVCWVTWRVVVKWNNLMHDWD